MVLRTKPPADRFVFERNPYYYRIDKAEHQLPYIDRVISRSPRQDYPGQDRSRRERSAGALLRFDNYTSSGERTAQTIQGEAMAHRSGKPARLYPNSCQR